MFSKLTAIIIPAPVRWCFLVAAALALFGLGLITGIEREGTKHNEYVMAQAAASIKLAKTQIRVIEKTEIQYRDRIVKIYEKGHDLALSVPQYVTPADADRCTVNAGFVRVYDAAFAGEPAGPAAESDREPAAVSLADVAEVTADNAAICLAWREQALTLRQLYQQLQSVTNGAIPGAH